MTGSRMPPIVTDPEGPTYCGVTSDTAWLEADGHEIKISNPTKVFWPDLGLTKLDLANYYRVIMPGLLGSCRHRPTTLYRWPNGVDHPDDAFFQKRVPHPPEWMQTTTVSFPSGRRARMMLMADGAHILWAVNLGAIDFNPWPVRVSDVDRPDELRVDLDPTPGVPFSDVLAAAPVVKAVLEEHGLVGWAKTSGKRGLHVYVRISPEWSFTEVRRAALALAREVERRMEGIATTAWWKEERTGVFVDYNQNARDRTIASVYSVRPVPDARVSCPVAWDEVEKLDPAAFTLQTVPGRFEKLGDPWEGMDEAVGSLDQLHDLAALDEAGGLGDAPWPPHFPKADREPRRVNPSRRRPD